MVRPAPRDRKVQKVLLDRKAHLARKVQKASKAIKAHRVGWEDPRSRVSLATLE